MEFGMSHRIKQQEKYVCNLDGQPKNRIVEQRSEF